MVLVQRWNKKRLQFRNLEELIASGRERKAWWTLIKKVMVNVLSENLQVQVSSKRKQSINSCV
jgi:hypothetical protein